MANYEARRNDDDPNERDHQNAKNTTKTAAKAAGAYFGGSAGAKAVDIASKTKAGDKILDKGAKAIEKNKTLRNLNNKLNDSGAVKAADNAIDASAGGGKLGAGNTNGGGLPNKSINQVKTGNGNVGGEQNNSLPSSLSKKDNSVNNKNLSGNEAFNNKDSKELDEKKSKAASEINEKTTEEASKQEKKSLLKSYLKLSLTIKAALFIFGPLLLILLFFMIVIGTVTNLFSEYNDAFGMSQTVGEETGNLYFEASDEEQQKFFDRVNDVKLEYQANGKNVDALKIVAVFHVLNTNGADIKYADMTTSKIKELANYMFDGNIYNENLFKNNLIQYVIPSYLPGLSKSKTEEIADDVFEYIENYYNLIGKEYVPACSGAGSCSYDIKGFSVNGQGNVSKNIQASNIKVRLMECGSPYGNGDYNKPIDQSLVDFENYVGGVAYAEIGLSAPPEAIKAQMVAARSYALSRASSNSNGKKLEKENDQWILQISSCVADQVFCNMNEGCSYMGGGDGQGGIVRSGIVSGAVKTMGPISEGDSFRSYLSQTHGEVLVNAQGYVIQTGYTDVEQKQFIELANKGLNYKQILLQVYNQGSRNYGASGIQKNSCEGANSANCISSGEYASWKQFQGPWIGVELGNSGKTIKEIGCLATSVSILIAKSGVPTNINNLNPGTFVEYLSSHGGFDSGGNFQWSSATLVAPSFKYQNTIYLSGMNKQQKFETIKNVVNQKGVYAVAEVKGNTGQHWVAIDSVVGDKINMIDPGSNSTDMWAQYGWDNTSTLVYYRVG